STPIIGGICALLLEAHPDWTPMQLREALLMTASQAAAPDTDYGWGIADGLAALDYVSATPHFRAVPHQKIFISAFPNPANSTTIWTLEIPEGLVGSFTITDILGRRISYIPEKRWAVGQHRIPFELSDLPSGTYFGRFATAAGQSVVRIAVVK
ncbi:MAG: T9SS type A sorting domain-containing protein, partial [Calditrichaeota bacterium]|nr:T9SS type A sorting domain-containing protein [Calditrichota bacterium]